MPVRRARWCCHGAASHQLTAWYVPPMCSLVRAVPAEWVKLLDNAGFGGTWDAKYTPLVTGSFTKVKAVHRSGYVTCDTDAVVDGNVWNECSDGTGVNYVSFALAKNSELVLAQPSWHQLPPSCTKPTTITGDIVCDINLDIGAGDTLTPTWTEAWLQTSLHDNGGDHYIDLYGWVARTLFQWMRCLVAVACSLWLCVCMVTYAIGTCCGVVDSCSAHIHQLHPRARGRPFCTFRCVLHSSRRRHPGCVLPDGWERWRLDGCLAVRVWHMAR